MHPKWSGRQWWWALAAVAAVAAPVQAVDEFGAEYGIGGWSPLIVEVIHSIDLVGFVLLAVLAVLIGMAVDLFNHLRISKLIPEDLLTEIQEEMANGEYERALEVCEKSNSLIGQVFAAALSKTDYSFERMSDALRGELAIQSLVWRQWIRQYKIFAILGGLFGLLGAVVGALRFFADLAGRTDFGLALASSHEVRSQIYSIFIAILIGLVMSVISLAIYTVASSKLEKVILEAGRLGEELLDPFRPLPLEE